MVVVVDLFDVVVILLLLVVLVVNLLFTGDVCQQNHDDCSGNPCGVGAECIDGIGMFTCKCPLGRTGNSLLSPSSTLSSFQVSVVILKINALLSILVEMESASLTCQLATSLVIVMTDSRLVSYLELLDILYLVLLKYLI